MTQNFFLACEGITNSNLNNLICSINSQPSNGIDWSNYQGLLVFIGWIVLVVGWIYTNHTNNLRESRKELKSLLDALIMDINALKDKALIYYVSPIKGSEQLSFEIVTAQHRIISRIELLSKKYPGIPLKTTTEIVHFMEAISGGDFDSYTRKVRSYSKQTNNHLLRICHKSDDLCNALESDFDLIVKSMDSSIKRRIINQWNNWRPSKINPASQ